MRVEVCVAKFHRVENIREIAFNLLEDHAAAQVYGPAKAPLGQQLVQAFYAMHRLQQADPLERALVRAELAPPSTRSLSWSDQW